MADATLQIVLDAKQALQNLVEFQAKATEGIGKVQETLESFKTAGEAALAFFAVDKIKEFIGEAVDAAAKQEGGQLRLQQALASTGEYSKEAAADMQEFAESLQSSSRFSEETITNALTIAKTFGLTNEQAQQLVHTSADLATRLGTDLNTQVEKLGMTFEGSTGRLKKMFPELEQFTAEQLKSGAAVEYIGERLDGSASAGMHTYEMATIQAGFAQDDLMKAIGHLITDSPAAIAKLEAFADTLKNVKDWIIANKEAIGEWVTTGINVMAAATSAGVEVLGFLGSVLEGLAGAVLTTAGALVDVFAPILQATTVTMQNMVDITFTVIEGMLGLADSIPGASDLFDKMGINIDDLRGTVGGLHQDFDDFTGGLEDGIAGASDKITDFTNGMGEGFGAVNEVFDGVQRGIDETAGKIAGAYRDMGDGSREFANRAKEAYESSAKEAQNFESELNRLDKSIFNAIADPADKARDVFETDMATLQELYDNDVISWTGYQQRKEDIAQIYADKIAEINTEDAPSGEDYSGVTNSIGAAVSSKDGQQAAKNFAATAIGAMAEDIPIIGPIMKQIVALAMEDPATSRAWAKSFTEAIPEIISNMSKAAPAIIGGFLEALKDPSFWKAAAQAYLDYLSGGWGQIGIEVGRLIGKSFGDSFNSDKIGHTLAKGWNEDVAWMKNLGQQWGKDWQEDVQKPLMQAIANFGRALAQFPENVKSLGKAWGHDFTEIMTLGLDGSIHGLQDWWIGVKHGFLELPEHFIEAFKDGEKYLETHFRDSIDKGAEHFSQMVFDVLVKQGAASIAASFHEGESYLSTHFRDSIDKAAEQFSQFIYNVFVKDIYHGFVEPMANAIAKPFQDLRDGINHAIQMFKDAVDKLTGGISSITGGGGGGGGGGGNGGYLGKVTGGLALTGPSDRSATKGLSLTSGTATAQAATLDTVVALLAQIAVLLSQPMAAKGEFKLDNRAFAAGILQLSRQNARTA